MRDLYLTDDPADAELLVDKAIEGCRRDEVPEIRALGRTLGRWWTEACTSPEGAFAYSWAFDRSRRPSRFCPGDFVQGRRVLAYGSSVRFGGSRCTSRRSGVTCQSLRTGHGFFLSRARQRIF